MRCFNLAFYTNSLDSLGKDCMQDGTTIGCGGGNRPRCCLGKTYAIPLYPYYIAK